MMTTEMGVQYQDSFIMSSTFTFTLSFNTITLLVGIQVLVQYIKLSDYERSLLQGVAEGIQVIPPRHVLGDCMRYGRGV